MNLNKITYSETLSIASQTSQPIRAFAEQANTIEILAPVSGYNTAFIVLQGLKDGELNPRLRATQRLLMHSLDPQGDYQRWNLVIPGQILNDMSTMKSTGVRATVQFYYVDGDCIGVEKYNTDISSEIIAELAADYPDATDGQFVRVIDTETDWYYDLATTTWIDYESKYLVGLSMKPTSAANFSLERGIYTDEPTHSPTNTELILQELALRVKRSGDTMLGDLDMDNNDIDNIRSLTLYDADGTAVISYNGTDLILNKGASNEEILTDTMTLADVANVIETNILTDDILIRSGANYVNISKMAFLQSIQTQIDTLDNEKADLVGGNTFLGLQKFMGGIETEGANLKGNKITNVADGTVATDGINKGQLDAEVTAIETSLLSKADLVGGLVPSSQLPSYVDDVLVYDTYADLPETGELSKLYVVIADELTGNDHSTYRWTTGGYILIHDEMSANEIKTLYESNADTNAFTDALKTKITDLYNKAQLDSLLSDIDTALGVRYTKTEVDALLDSLKAIYGWESSDLTPTALGDTDTLALSAVADYDQLLFVCRNTATGEIDTQKVPIVELTNGTNIEFFNSTSIMAEVDATNITFSDVGTSETLKIYGIKMEQQLAENIAYDTTNVKEALDEVNSIKSEIKDFSHLNVNQPNLTGAIDLGGGIYQLDNQYLAHDSVITYNSNTGEYEWVGTGTYTNYRTLNSLENGVQYTIKIYDVSGDVTGIRFKIDAIYKTIEELLDEPYTFVFDEFFMFSKIETSPNVNGKFKMKVEKGDVATPYTLPLEIPSYATDMQVKEKATSFLNQPIKELNDLSLIEVFEENQLLVNPEITSNSWLKTDQVDYNIENESYEITGNYKGIYQLFASQPYEQEWFLAYSVLSNTLVGGEFMTGAISGNEILPSTDLTRNIGLNSQIITGKTTGDSDRFFLYTNDVTGYIEIGNCYLVNMTEKEIVTNVDVMHKWFSIYLKLKQNKEIGIVDFITEKYNELNSNLNILYGKTIYSFGDSIAYGNGYLGGYSKIIADNNEMNFTNYAVGGATIIEEVGSSNNILNQISGASSLMPDYILFNGYTNDAGRTDITTTKLGSISSGFNDVWDTSTFVGAMEKTISELLNKFIGSRIVFVTTHINADRDYATQKTLREKAVEVCNKWGISVADVYKDGNMNTFILEYLTAYTDNNSSHPNYDGYNIFYVPVILKTL